MITINLSDEQAKSLLNSMGWRFVCGDVSCANIDEKVASEIFTQLENRLMPPPTEAAEVAVWKHESGVNAKTVEYWKRKHEVME